MTPARRDGRLTPPARRRCLGRPRCIAPCARSVGLVVLDRIVRRDRTLRRWSAILGPNRGFPLFDAGGWSNLQSNDNVSTPRSSAAGYVDIVSNSGSSSDHLGSRTLLRLPYYPSGAGAVTAQVPVPSPPCASFVLTTRSNPVVPMLFPLPTGAS